MGDKLHMCIGTGLNVAVVLLLESHAKKIRGMRSTGGYYTHTTRSRIKKPCSFPDFTKDGH